MATQSQRAFTVTTRLGAATTVSSTISQRIGSSSDLERFARGLVDRYFPANYQEYKQYRRFMHDIVCVGLVDAGFYSKESLSLADFNLTSDDKRINDQRPDLYTIEDRTIRVCEVSLSFDVDTMEAEKSTKYDDLFNFLESKGYTVLYRTLVVDLTDPEWEDSIPVLGETHRTMLNRFVSNLIIYHATPKGMSLREQSIKKIDINFPFTYEKEPLIRDFSAYLNIQQPSPETFDYLTEGFGKLDLGDQRVHDYIDALTDTILTKKPHERPFPNPRPLEPKKFLEDWEKYKSLPSTKSKPPVVLQLGAPTLTDETNLTSREELYKLTETPHYGGYVDHIKSTRTTLEEFREYPILRLHLTDSELESEMMSGPGRKKYLKSKGLQSERKAPTHISPNSEHIFLVNELIDLVSNQDSEDYLLPYVRSDYEVTGNNMGDLVNKSMKVLRSDGTDFLLQFYSRLSSEIILNSMRRRKQREYVLGHSGFEGIYFLIAPGPQLRTETNVEFVKIISFTEPIVHQLSRSWLPIGDHWESEWCSVDTDRLKHWCRSRDRVNLSIIGSAEKLVTSEVEPLDALKEEVNLKNYALMALIYLENKNSTSITIQTTRYVMMKSLGDKQLNSLFSKFPERCSSVIQSLVMIRMIDFAKTVCGAETSDFVRVQSVKRDDNLGTLDETSTGVVGAVPRIFTNGPNVPIKYIINEIYWCMMYNKDRQNQAQDAMKILKKIAKEERNLIKQVDDLPNDNHKIHYVFGFHPTQSDVEHIKTDRPRGQYYSRLAVSIGIALQDHHKENFSPNGSWLTASKVNSILMKNLSEYATFKASVKEIQSLVENDDLNHIKKIGSRTKCIELIHSIVSDEKMTVARDVAMQFSGVNSSNFKTVIQIFKKNQIGGVREILILYIKARVLINLSEEICRLLSKSDKRETLTKGKDKRLMMRGDYEELSSSFPEGTPLYVVKNSYDMATWCQKFIPTIFLPIFNHHSEGLQNLYELCKFVLLNHCLKEIEYPRKLVEQWIKHPEIEHSESHMEYYKRKFLQDRVPKMVNFSNMGQGILHYCSTVMALSASSLRDHLFTKCLEKLGRPSAIKWKTRVGSDDKGDTIMADMTCEDYIYQLQLFEQCALASERLHAMELSVKSASGNVIYEFNSAYMANLEVQSPIIKFTLAAVDMIGTDSCAGFVNESYSRIRQLRENGASSFVCYIAHCMNKLHHDQIFRTGKFMTNDPTSIFQLPPRNIPYDLGIYPIYDCDLQDMIGPDYHNYIAFTDKETPEYILRMVYTEAFDIEENQLSNDENLYKKTDFRINQGLVKQLVNMRERLNLSREEIQNYLTQNPFLLIRGPLDVTETSIVIASKLFTRGAATSLRRTSPAIYIGRLAAFESAKAWNVMVTNEDETQTQMKMTFRQYIEFIKTQMSNCKYETSLKDYKVLIFPQHNSYEVVRTYVNVHGIRKHVTKMLSQSVRTWTLNNYNYNFSSSLKSMLETSFGLAKTAPPEEVKELRKHIPFDLSSYEGFINDCQAKGVRPLDIFFYMQSFYKNSQTKKAQVFATGPSTTTLNLTLSNLKRYNHMSGSIMDIDPRMDDKMRESEHSLFKDLEALKLAFNMRMLETQGAIKSKADTSVLDLMVDSNVTYRSKIETILRSIKSIRSFDNQTKKMILLLASTVLTVNEFKHKLLDWRQLSYTYVKQQRKNEHGNWVGDLQVLVHFMNECYMIHHTSGYYYVETNRIVDNSDFHQSFLIILRILGIDKEYFTRLTDIEYGMWYLMPKGVYKSRGPMKNKFRLNLQFNHNFQFVRLNDLSDFKLETTVNKSGATVLTLRSKTRGHINVSHFPGHYHPVEIPKSTKFNWELFVNGLRAVKLFKNRKWFFDGRLHPFTTKESVDILRNHVRPLEMKEISDETSTKIQDFIEEFEINTGDTFDMTHELVSRPITAPQLNADFNRQMDNASGGKSIMEMFQQAANQLSSEAWDAGSFDADDFGNMEDDMAGFVLALGENQQKKKKDFYTITNLKLNQSFILRVLDLFFKGSNILAEDKRDLPDYAIHVMKETHEELDDSMKFLFVQLRNYIINRISTVTGSSIDTVYTAILKMSQRKKNYQTLKRLNKYLDESGSGDEFYDMLGYESEQASDSDGEFD
uniref:RNA-directed RNA polymerase L n=1 Tax=Zhangzhou tick virus 1 TaxID=2972284 RepID=A0A9E8AD83_9VIRU|nr:MAG: RNA-dependent RNA polymerase [Zhangzhou tick virus 1]